MGGSLLFAFLWIEVVRIAVIYLVTEGMIF